ncbi:hypothetical protein FRC09_000202 [Ceratobasidium sp. 395]|nr:hypothetical protein FRC09_000202 [Ceratobasidium sp. 395]
MDDGESTHLAPSDSGNDVGCYQQRLRRHALANTKRKEAAMGGSHATRSSRHAMGKAGRASPGTTWRSPKQMRQAELVMGGSGGESTSALARDTVIRILTVWRVKGAGHDSGISSGDRQPASDEEGVRTGGRRTTTDVLLSSGGLEWRRSWRVLGKKTVEIVAIRP